MAENNRLNGKAEFPEKGFSVCVYCASSPNIPDVYFQTAHQLGKLFAKNNITCINGAGSSGLMGALNDAILEHGGKVKGIIPRFMVDSGWCHRALTETVVTETMHERKQAMAHAADAVVALPGGVGTMEELMEIITWKQLGLFSNPIVIANINGYYTPILEMLSKMVDEHFMAPFYLEMWQVAESPEEVLDCLRQNKIWKPDLTKYAAKEL